ncbi:hypothetical protein ACH4UR_31110 [Streptomyces lydicus]|uniref:hypothetical protein n=1 Tax=Streptomyces lydicus TaxID=47763 RepID=UPI0033F67B86
MKKFAGPAVNIADTLGGGGIHRGVAQYVARARVTVTRLHRPRPRPAGQRPDRASPAGRHPHGTRTAARPGHRDGRRPRPAGNTKARENTLAFDRPKSLFGAPHPARNGSYDVSCDRPGNGLTDAPMTTGRFAARDGGPE